VKKTRQKSKEDTGCAAGAKRTFLVEDGRQNISKRAIPARFPRGAMHDAKGEGDKSLKVIGIYVIDKTAPLASPAP